MIKNVYHSCDTQSIINDLKDQGFKVLKAFNKLKWKSKEPLDVFLVVFDANGDKESPSD